jgi:hypothetical protein
MIDENFWELFSTITAIQNHPPEAISISHFSITSDQLTIYLTDHSSQVLTMPTSAWHFTNPPTGAWLPNTLYFTLDVVTTNGAVYLCLQNHTSGSTFNPFQTDGSGHNLWVLLLSPPGLQLPRGGISGQVLSKVSSVDFDTAWITYLQNPSGGSTGQTLIKNSNVTGDYGWQTLFLNSNLADVNLVSLAANQVLAWDGGSHWFNFTLDLANIPGQLDVAQMPNVNTPLGAISGTNDIIVSHGTMWNFTPNGNVTLTSLAALPQVAQLVVIKITAVGTSYNITFGSGFLSQGVLATGTAAGKIFTVTFIGDGTVLSELSRSIAM